MIRFALTGILAFVLAGTAGALAGPPRLTLLDRQPLVVRGTHFAPRELVRVSATGDEPASARVRATRAGTFVVRFEGLTLGRCGGVGIRAVGNRGSVAVLKIPLPTCLPARQP